MYHFGRCLDYSKGIDQALVHADKCHPSSAEEKNAATDHSFGICQEQRFAIKPQRSSDPQTLKYRLNLFARIVIIWLLFEYQLLNCPPNFPEF
jgi:hypothetical protein